MNEHTVSRIAMFTVALQARRIRSSEPEDDAFVFRRWADYEFLVLALWRLRGTAQLALRTPKAADLPSAISDFDNALPSLRQMRDVLMHTEDYAMDVGHHESVSRRSLEVGAWNEGRFEWIAVLDVAVALSAAEALFNAICARCPATRRRPDG